MLVDAGDAASDHLARIAERPRFAGDLDLPAVGATAPVRILISVDLPAPFEPIKRAHFAGHRRSKSASSERDQSAVDLGEPVPRIEGRSVMRRHRPCRAGAGADEQQPVVADRGEQDRAGDDLLHELRHAEQVSPSRMAPSRNAPITGPNTSRCRRAG